MKVPSRQIVLGGVLIDVLSRREWAEKIVGYCRLPRGEGTRPKVVFAANGQIVTEHAINPEYRRLFQQADAVSADGQPLVWASRLTRFPLPERAATTDIVHDVAKAAEAEGLSFFLLGATEQNNAVACAKLTERYPRLRVAGRRNGYFKREEEAGIIRDIQDLKPDILWVGFGMGKQEEFVIRNREQLSAVGCIITCGGLFDHFTDEVERAPDWMQSLSLEWLFRTWQEPRKYFWRYLTTNPAAMVLLLTRTRSHAPGREASPPA